MKRLKVFFVFLFLTAVLGAQDFEGFVKYKIEAAGETTFMKYYKKGNMVRMEPEIEDMQMGGGAIIFKNDKTYMLMPEQKMYMEFGDDMMGMMKDEMQSEMKEEDFTKPTKTGETKDILGYACEKWIFEDDGNTVELWAAKGLGNFVMLSAPMSEQKMPDWYNEIAEEGFFPMQVKDMDSDGNVESTMEVVDIKAESVSDDMFEIPSNFSKFSMPGMN